MEQRVARAWEKGEEKGELKQREEGLQEGVEILQKPVRVESEWRS